MLTCSRSSSDPLLSELIKKGINLIVPPRDDLVPGDLILANSDGKGARKASWGPVLGSDPHRDVIARSTFKAVSLKVSDRVKLGIGAKIFGAMLKPLGFDGGSAEGSLASLGCSSLTMRLVAPAGSSIVDLDEILENLRAGGAAPNPAYEGRSFYVATTVWRARGLEFDLYDQNGKQIGITTKMADQLETELKLKLDRKATQTLSFVAQTALIFGIEVRKLKFDEGLLLDETVTSPVRFQGEESEAVEARGFAWLGDDNAFVLLDDEPSPESVD